jgi:hypothetical protein
MTPGFFLSHRRPANGALAPPAAVWNLGRYATQGESFPDQLGPIAPPSKPTTRRGLPTPWLSYSAGTTSTPPSSRCAYRGTRISSAAIRRQPTRRCPPTTGSLRVMQGFGDYTISDPLPRSRIAPTRTRLSTIHGSRRRCRHCGGFGSLDPDRFMDRGGHLLVIELPWYSRG